ncbi:heme peroxidase [Xylariales sp. PMI_506]|nr:heme peroxidase [Xylariales sp. PMI_506]
MRVSALSVAAGTFSCVAASLGPVSEPNQLAAQKRQSSSCPSVWTDVATDLKSIFVDDNGDATDDARAAIRVSFHDCFPEACDGSMILANECTDRGENSQMISICGTLGDMATEYNVSTADIIQLGTALGIRAALGPTISFKVGRNDTTTANPEGVLPGPNTDAATLVSDFAAKGFSASELVALVGAHSAGKNLSGVALDTTVDVLDTTFYGETLNGTAPASIQADINLSTGDDTAADWEAFATGSLASWESAFVPAMEKMSVLGNDEASLIDCSSIVTDTFPTRRAVRAPRGRGSRPAH